MPDVLVDLTPLETPTRFTGIGRYVEKLGSALADLSHSERQGLEIAALTALSGPSPVGPLTWKGSPSPLFGDGDVEETRWLMARRTRLAATLRTRAPRLFHATQNLGTPRGSGVPRVLTCHDVVRLVMPHDYLAGRPAYRWILHGLEIARFRSATRVIAISRHTADDIIRLLGVPASRIDVVPHGVDLDRFRPPRPGAEAEAASAILRKWSLADRPYLLHLGAADPRKNVDTLIHGFARAKLEGVDLVLIGKLKPSHQATVDRALDEIGRPPSVRQLGYVHDADLPPILSGALALPFTSTYEGFGFTPLEAMACNCPVIATGLTSIGEVVGDAALLVPPRDPGALASALRRIATEATLAGDLRRAGLSRAAQFTWRKAALGTVDSYARALRR
ncbi:MAG: glycosyltransferase family 4 protein [Polyangiaceae bacterium]|nr:glycosyltransferase family 4 protein [Polyangiaceae bacterium]